MLHRRLRYSTFIFQVAESLQVEVWIIILSGREWPDTNRSVHTTPNTKPRRASRGATFFLFMWAPPLGWTPPLYPYFYLIGKRKIDLIALVWQLGCPPTHRWMKTPFGKSTAQRSRADNGMCSCFCGHRLFNLKGKYRALLCFLLMELQRSNSSFWGLLRSGVLKVFRLSICKNSGKLLGRPSRSHSNALASIYDLLAWSITLSFFMLNAALLLFLKHFYLAW